MVVTSSASGDLLVDAATVSSSSSGESLGLVATPVTVAAPPTAPPLPPTVDAATGVVLSLPAVAARVELSSKKRQVSKISRQL